MLCFFNFLMTFLQLSQFFSLQDLVIHKNPGEKLGISIRGGTSNQFGNPFDKTDEGIFISRVCISFDTSLYPVSVNSMNYIFSC